MGDKKDVSKIEIDAMADIEEGQVSDILKMVRKERIPEDVKAKVMEALPQAVRVATKKGWLTEAIEVIGAEDVPEAVQMKIVDILAEGGWVSEVLDIIGAGNTSDAVHDKARLALPKALDAGGEDKIEELTAEEKIKAFGVLTRLLLPLENPLQKDGVLSGGTVKKPALVGKEQKTPNKGLTNKS